MRQNVGFIVTALWCLFTGIHSADPEFCSRGFQIAGKYHTCWEQATYANKFPPLYERHEVYTPQLVENYATHMCSVVKPVALQCLREEVAECSDAAKIVETADESGGACVSDHLNPFFKLHIIDHLVPVRADSGCFGITDVADECYATAGEEIVQSGVNMVDISRFHKVADKFFSSIWNCLVDNFKSHSDECENWQLPMLLVLQRTAMPSLFGMRLTNDQVAKLELESNNNNHGNGKLTTPSQKDDCDDDEEEEDSSRFYIMLKVLEKKPPQFEGDLLLQIDHQAGQKPQISVAQSTNAQDSEDVNNFIGQITSSKEDLSDEDIRKLRKEQRKKNKEIDDYLRQLKIAQRRRRKQNKKNKKNNGNNKNKDKKNDDKKKKPQEKNNKEVITPGDDIMIN